MVSSDHHFDQNLNGWKFQKSLLWDWGQVDFGDQFDGGDPFLRCRQQVDPLIQVCSMIQLDPLIQVDPFQILEQVDSHAKHGSRVSQLAFTASFWRKGTFDNENPKPQNMQTGQTRLSRSGRFLTFLFNVYVRKLSHPPQTIGLPKAC